MMPRRFGIQINGDRKVLGSLPLQPKLVLRQSNAQAFPLKKPLSNDHPLEDQENQEYFNFKTLSGKNSLKQDSFKILDESHDEGVFSQDAFQNPNSVVSAEEILDRSYEAMKKNLNSFLIDSEEKLEADKTDSTYHDSLISINCDSINKTTSACDEESLSSDLMEHSDCSLAPPTPFSSFDLFADYSSDILNYCLQIERSFMADPFYMAKQFEINGKMRAILVDWLVDVSDEYDLEDETLFLTVQYIDRYLSRASITRSEFQLLGISSLFIASKYEEIYPPELKELAHTTDDSATKSQILAMEKNILRVLDFDVSAPTSFYF